MKIVVFRDNAELALYFHKLRWTPLPPTGRPRGGSVSEKNTRPRSLEEALKRGSSPWWWLSSAKNPQVNNCQIHQHLAENIASLFVYTIMVLYKIPNSPLLLYPTRW